MPLPSSASTPASCRRKTGKSTGCRPSPGHASIRPSRPKAEISLPRSSAKPATSSTNSQPVLMPHQVLQNVQFQSLVVAIGPVLLHGGSIKAANHTHQAQENFAAIGQVPGLVRCFGCSHGFDVQADAALVVGPLQHPNRIKRPPQIHRAKYLVLVVFKTILIV